MEGTPVGEPVLLEINNQLINISESGPNQVSMCFDELSENLRHQVKDYQLQKINYKTVISSLKKLHPNILKASLHKNSDELFVMTITVTYEFLPQITEEIMFSKRQIKPQQSEEVAVRNMKNYLRNLKAQIKSMTNIQVISGQLNDLQKNHEVSLSLNFPKTLISWTIKISNPNTTTLKAQLFYYNSITKQRQSSKFIPDDGVFMYYTTNECTVELRFIVDQSDKYDSVILEVEGKHKGSYIVTIEKATSA